MLKLGISFAPLNIIFLIHLLADKNLYLIEQFLPADVQLSLYNPARGIPDLTGVDAFLIQTVTKLNAHTLPNPSEQLKFIGTGSSGIDHIDVDYFTQKGIKVVNAKGCNANAVAEFVITSILLWREVVGQNMSPGKIGVIGAGSAGSAVIKLIENFGWDYAAYDPPRAEIDPDFSSSALEEVLECDILTFHVPLTINDPYPTFHWLDENKLENRDFKLIINASRGGVVDEKALLKAHKQGNVEQFVLDVWENEPAFSDEAAQKAYIATPHIAGYSVQAKTRATQMVMSSLTEYFELRSLENVVNQIAKSTATGVQDSSLSTTLKGINPILDYDSKLRKLIGTEEKASEFRDLRNNFPFRDEYPYLKISSEVAPESHLVLKNLGIEF